MTAVRTVRMPGLARPVWRPARVPDTLTRWRRWTDENRPGINGNLDWLLLRGVLVVGLLLGIVLVAGVARRALDMPVVTPAAAAGVTWLVSWVGIVGWMVLAVVGAYRGRSAGN